jgi:hypothetical protein
VLRRFPLWLTSPLIPKEKDFTRCRSYFRIPSHFRCRKRICSETSTAFWTYWKSMSCPQKKRMRTIEVRPYCGGWKVFETPSVEPFYVGPNAKEHAASYATEGLKFSGGEVRILNIAGAVEGVIN